MFSLTELKKDALIQIEGVPYRIIESQHSKVARGGAVVRTKLKNLLDGGVRTETFKGNDKVEPARVDKVDMQFLYHDGQDLVLMDLANFEQLRVSNSMASEAVRFIAEGSKVVAQVYNGRVIGLEIPAKLELKVSQTEPGAQGDTANAALKPAKLESGATIQVPLFIKTGDTIRVDTRNGSYLERAN